MGPNPWLAAAILGAVIGAGVQGYRMGRDSVIASQARSEAVRLETLQLAQQAAAAEIAKIQIRHTTIRQQAEQVIRERQIYLDCRNDDTVRELLDAARENRGVAAGDRSVP